MRFLLLYVVFPALLSNVYAQDEATQLVVARIHYIYNVKRSLGNTIWPSFGKAQYNVPLIYYSGDTTFIANPHPKFVQEFKPALVSSKRNIDLFRLDYRLDTNRLRMFVSMNPGSDTTAYDFDAPYMQCSSREEFVNVTGFQSTTQGWAAIVLHECFHGFQFLHEDFRQYAFQNSLTNGAIGEALQELYKTQAWYKASVDTENELLLQAIRSTRTSETDSLIRAFFAVRAERRSHIETGADLGFSFLEKGFETIEGTARFIEAEILAHPLKDKRLREIDPHFKVDEAAVATDIEQLAKATTGNYYYATGYNMLRLLKKMNIDYSSRLFIEPSLTLEELLKASLQ